MNQKLLVISFLAAVVLSFAAGFIFKDVIPNSLFRSSEDVFFDITEALEDYYYYDINDAVQLNAYISQLDAIVEAYAAYFDDPYTRIEAYDMTEITTEDYVGMGVSLIFEGVIPIVYYVYYEAPAYQKLYPGDAIIGIIEQNETVAFNTLTSIDEVLSYLKASQYDTKTLIVSNPDGITRNVEITYDFIPMTNVEVKSFYGGEVSYIRIHEFTSYVNDTAPGTAHAFSEALSYVEDHGLDADGTLIIDLRDNPGGALSALHNMGFPSYPPGIIQQLLPYQMPYPAFELINNNNQVTSYKGGLTSPKPYDIVVLVNGQSASASEVLAGALSSYGYRIYGEETFGKFVYQNQYPLTQINEKEYVLVYTEGVWTYKDGVTVDEDPIDIIPFDAHPYHDIERMTYTGELHVDSVNISLSVFQQFLNIYYQASIREDGYFDSETLYYVQQFQAEQSIFVSQSINYETYQKMYDVYLLYTQDITYDTQVNALVLELR